MIDLSGIQASAVSASEMQQTKMVSDQWRREARGARFAEARVDRTCEDLQKQHAYNVAAQHEALTKIARVEVSSRGRLVQQVEQHVEQQAEARHTHVVKELVAQYEAPAAGSR